MNSNIRKINRGLLIMMLSLISVSLSAQFGGGTGSLYDPWQIETAAHLDSVRYYLSDHFIQKTDINLADSLWSSGEGWEPIGDENNPFRGSYDGNGYVVDSLYIDRSDLDADDSRHVGLFGYIDEASIAKLGVTNFTIKQQFRFYTTGSLVGYSNNKSDIDYCYSTGVYTGWYTQRTGGLVGINANKSSIRNSYTDVTLEPNNRRYYPGMYGDLLIPTLRGYGGIVYRNTNGSIIDGCYSLGDLNGFYPAVTFFDPPIGPYDFWLVMGSRSASLGGLAAINTKSSTIMNSHNSGNIKIGNGDHNDNYIGGLVARNLNGSIISNCYNEGNIGYFNNRYHPGENITRAGGLVGILDGGSRITGSYNGGDISQIVDFAGGLVGRARGIIEDSYNTGNLYFIPRRYSWPVGGGLAGSISDENSRVSNCYNSGRLNKITPVEVVERESLRFPGVYLGYNSNPVEVVERKSLYMRRSSEDGLNVFRDTGRNKDLPDLFIGGLIGRNGIYTDEGDVRDRAEIINSYWDVNTSGISTSDGGVGRPTHVMVTQNSFEDWSFPHKWHIEEGGSYPYLFWQEESARHNRPGPSDLTVSINDLSVPSLDLRWRYPTTAISRVDIYRDGLLVGSADYPSHSWMDSGENLQKYEHYTYHVVGVIVSGEDERETVAGREESIVIHEPFAGGRGTKEDPWLIVTAGQLNKLRYYLGAEHHRQFFKQIVDIDLGVPPWNNGSGWDPIGYGETKENNTFFGGNYDGNGYTISGLYINRPDSTNQGLFGYTSGLIVDGRDNWGAYYYHLLYFDSLWDFIPGNKIINVNLTGVDITGGNNVGSLVGKNDFMNIINCSVAGNISGTGNSCGGLVGLNMNTGGLLHCKSEADVKGKYSVGGLVGSMNKPEDPAYDDHYDNTDYVVLSHSTGTIEGLDDVGGVAGWCYGTFISNSYSSGTVKGNNNVGGLVGWSLSSHFENHSSGVVKGNNNVGGLVGWGERGFIETYSSAVVKGNNNVGGLAGAGTAVFIRSYSAATVTAAGNGAGGIVGLVPIDGGGMITESYNIGKVSGNSYVGGLVGLWQRGIITNSFSIGSVEGEDKTGGLLGFIGPTAEAINSYWDVDTSGQEDSAAGEGRSTAEMTHIYDEDTYEDWDFKDIWGTDSEYFVNNGYPYLQWQFSDKPTIAVNPSPGHGAKEVRLPLEELSWDYIVDSNHHNPVGFRVYLNTTGDFDESDEFTWVAYDEEEERYYCYETADSLDYSTTYYWQVVPTTKEAKKNRYSQNDDHRKRRRGDERLSYPAETLYRDDAEDPEIWLFTTAPDPSYPLPATNPDPPDKTEDIVIDLQQLSWEYEYDDYFVTPVGFRLYMNTTGDFEEEHHYEWIDYTFGQQNYSSIIHHELFKNTTYYWQVIPTTIDPNMDYEALNVNLRRSKRSEDRDVAHDARSFKRRSSGERTTYQPALREGNDAIDGPVWSFTTGIKTSVEQPLIPEVTSLNRNYPNPFNPKTAIEFSLANDGDITLEIYDIRGRRVNTLIREHFRAGHHSLVWNGEDTRGRKMPSGIYLYRLKTEDKILTRRMMLIK